MKRALEYSSMFDITVISHCEDMDIVDEGVMNEGYWSTIMGLRGIPSAAEEIMVARGSYISGVYEGSDSYSPCEYGIVC